MVDKDYQGDERRSTTTAGSGGTGAAVATEGKLQVATNGDGDVQITKRGELKAGYTELTDPEEIRGALDVYDREQLVDLWPPDMRNVVGSLTRGVIVTKTIELATS